MKLNLIASGAGLFVVAGAVVAGVALAQSPTHHAAPKQPAQVAVVSTPTPSLSAPVSSAAPSQRPVHKAHSTHRAVAPKETTVSEPSSEPSTSEPATFIPVTPDSAGRAGNAPPLPQPTPPPVAVPSGYNQPSS